MTAINGGTIYEPCMPDGEGHDKCVGVALPADGDAPAIGPCACTCHQGVVVLSAKPDTLNPTDMVDALTWALDVIEDNTDSASAEESPAYMAAWHHATETRDKAQQAATVLERTPAGFVRLVANMNIEGECADHGHAIADCGDDQCCNDDCETYEPDGNDDEITTLYELIATARQLRKTAPLA